MGADITKASTGVMLKYNLQNGDMQEIRPCKTVNNSENEESQKF